MREVGDTREQLRLDVLARHEQLDRLDSGRACGLDEVLALRDEQTELVPPAAVLQLADELELLVCRGGDHAGSCFSQWSRRLSTRIPARSYSRTAPVGFDPSTPSPTRRLPRAWSSPKACSSSARPRPRRRHGRRTPRAETQPNAGLFPHLGLHRQIPASSPPSSARNESDGS